MILYKITFGTFNLYSREEAEYVADDYLRMLPARGQADWGYVFVVQDDELCAYIDIAGVQAHKSKYHSSFGCEQLKNVTAWFGQEPVWERLDDGGPRRDTTWTGAPYLYLFTTYLSCEPPLRRGDTGKAIPVYRLPGEPYLPGHPTFHCDIGSWQTSYRDHDSIWMSSGKLEIPAYKQLALAESDLSRSGRDRCEEIEEATGVPTYYYLHRYYGHRDGEDKRKCPGCGRRWRTKFTLDGEGFAFHRFGFKCDKCRLVSHVASCDDEVRHAHIGEWQPAKK